MKKSFKKSVVGLALIASVISMPAASHISSGKSHLYAAYGAVSGSGPRQGMAAILGGVVGVGISAGLLCGIQGMIGIAAVS